MDVHAQTEEYAAPMADLTTCTAPGRQFLCVYASQVAACIGANRHKKTSDALEAMWARIAPEAYYAAMARCGLKTQDQNINEIMARSDAVKTIIDQTLVSACDTSQHVANAYESVSKVVMDHEELGTDEKRAVNDVCKRNLYTTFGNVRESYMLQNVQQVLGVECLQDPTFYKQQVGSVRLNGEDIPWHVGGKIDAINPERSLVIEIKSRVHKLFYKIPYHEYIQLQTYLQLLQINHGVLCECYAPAPNNSDRIAMDHRTANIQINMAPQKRDPLLWNNEIIPKLQKFMNFLAAILEETQQARALQDTFLKSKRKAAMIASFSP